MIRTILILLFPVFAFGQQGMLLVSSPAAGGGDLLLDTYTGAEAAYAMNLLSSDYSGSCIRVRRDSDDAESDIGFSGNDIDETTLLSFCASTDCFVTTWYDQSGEGNNATQTTDAKQPQIVSSGTIIKNGDGEVAIRLFDDDGSNTEQHMIFPVWHTVSTQVLNVFAVYEYNSTNGFYGALISNVDALYINQDVGELRPRIVSVRGSVKILRAGDKLSTENPFLLYAGVDRTNLFWGYNNNALTTGSDVDSDFKSTSKDYYIGNSEAINKYDYDISLIICYPSDQSSNRTAIETIINNYYSIY